MSIREWWDERKRLQAERDALEYGSWDEEASAEEPTDEAEPDVEAEVEAEPEVAVEPDPEPEPEPVEETVDEPEPVAEEEHELIPQESWWKRRLLGTPDRRPAAAPDPAADIAPEPEILPDEAEALEAEPAATAEPEPAEALEPEPEPEPEEPEPQPEPEPEPEVVEALEPEPEPEPLEPEPEPEVVEALEPEPAPEPEEPEEVHYDLGPLDDEEMLAEPDPEIDLRAAPGDALAPVGSDVPGPRRARLESERRKKRRQELKGGMVAAAVAAAVAIAGVISILARDEEPEPPAGAVAQGTERQDTITTTLLFGTKERRPDAGPTWMTLLSFDSATGRASVIYIPAHTATGVPGRGLLPVGDALASGGVPLLLLATETLLGTPVDQYVELSDADAAVLLRELGSLTVEVPEDVRVSAGPGQARLIFGAGAQRLNPEFLVELLYVKGLEGDDVELGARHLAFWGSLFEAFAFDADGLAAAVRRSGAALGEADVRIEDVARVFQQLAEAESGDRTLALLPVQQVGVGGSELYQVDEDEVEQFLRDTVGEQAVSGKEVRIQILNGNGSPGVGQYVAERLGGEGFRVILSGNARRLNYRETLVITYDRSSKGLGLAERTRDLIGVGEVQVAAQSQGIVDLTIVVGKDFLETL